MKQVPY